MTPREKARELIDKFHRFTYTSVHAYKTSGDYSVSKPTPLWRGQKCALIAVDEILNILEADVWGLEMDKAFDKQKYWEEVKQEIEKF